MTFLRRLGFDVAEGAGYEARDIPEKVGDRIRSQDIFLCVATPGDSSWLLSEAAFAKALGKHVIILCQADVEFNKGIIGSEHEYLSFPRGNVEKIYCDLLYALPT
jgi:ribosome maturation factor RimP